MFSLVGLNSFKSKKFKNASLFKVLCMIEVAVWLGAKTPVVNSAFRPCQFPVLGKVSLMSE